MSVGIEIIKIFVAIQDVTSPDKYNVFLFEMRKQISTNKILVVVLKKSDTHISVKNKQVYKLMRQYRFDLCISSIKNLVPRSVYLSLYGFKDEHEMIINYIENFNSILIEGQKTQTLNTNQEIFLLDTDSQSNKWKWDIYKIKPVTIGFMVAIQYGLIKKNGALLSAFLAVE